MTRDAVVTGFALMLLWALALPGAARADTADARVAPLLHSQAESQLLAALGLVQQGDYDHALSDLSDLISKRPNFKLAQLVYGELMVARAGHGISPDLDARLTSQRNALLDEAKTRWAHRSQQATDGKVPAAILQLAPEYAHIVVADLSSNRVYLFANDSGVPRLIADFYATIGRGGAGKQVEGDMRTPVGIYHITHYIDDAQLPELYGVGALPINYPNAYDRSLGRTGHGIWLHGVPRATYARTPRASEGCVVLANDDFKSLLDHVNPGVTPVILTRDIQWISLAKAEKARESMLATIADWQHSWQSIDTQTYLAYYAPDFSTVDGKDKAAFAAIKKKINAHKTRIKVALDQLSIFRYPGKRKLMKVTFNQHYKSNDYDNRSRKTQYWQQNDQGHWQIVLASDDG